MPTNAYESNRNSRINHDIVAITLKKPKGATADCKNNQPLIAC